MLYNREDLENALKDDILYIDKEYNYEIDNFVLDNREIKENSLFIAKKGEKNDGHNFIKNILETSNNSIIIAEYLPKEVEKNSRIILVKNTVKAFENLARYSRKRITGHVIGITGSVGKTSSKEIYKKCLSNIGKTTCNIKSFNNYFGVMSTILNTPKDTEFAIFEMGISEVNEMDKLREIVLPNTVIILEIFSNHIGNFKNELEIVNEKSKISNNKTNIVILKKDSVWFDTLFNDAKNKNIKNILEYGKDSKIYIKEHKIIDNKAKITYSIFDKNYSFESSNIDYNMAYNLLPIIAFANFLNLDLNKIFEGFKDYETFDGRNNIEKFKNLTVINGSYNANVSSFISGLNLMKNISCSRKVCIWGDILELGEKSKEIHMQLVEPVLKNKIDLFIAIGENMKIVSENLKNNNIKTLYFENIDLLIEEYVNIIKPNDLIFIKSSNGVKTWKLIDNMRNFLKI